MQPPQPTGPVIFQMWPSSTGSRQLCRLPDTSRAMDYNGFNGSVDDKGSHRLWLLYRTLSTHLRLP